MKMFAKKLLICIAAASVPCAAALGGLTASAAGAEPAAPNSIVRMDPAASPERQLRYPPAMIVAGDGAYLVKIGYQSEDEKFVVGIWESGPGVLKTDSYPHDEFCRVLRGHLITTDRAGKKQEFNAGDTFVIPKGWAGSWKMTSRFKKQYVSFDATEASH